MQSIHYSDLDIEIMCPGKAYALFNFIEQIYSHVVLLFEFVEKLVDHRKCLLHFFQAKY